MCLQVTQSRETWAVRSKYSKALVRFCARAQPMRIDDIDDM